MAQRDSKSPDPRARACPAAPIRRLTVLISLADVRKDDWTFVCGESDQGLFWYMLFVLHGVGTWLPLPHATGSAAGSQWRNQLGAHYWRARDGLKLLPLRTFPSLPIAPLRTLVRQRQGAQQAVGAAQPQQGEARRGAAVPVLRPRLVPVLASNLRMLLAWLLGLA